MTRVCSAANPLRCGRFIDQEMRSPLATKQVMIGMTEGARKMSGPDIVPV